jgi:hypothetical protein
VALLVVRLLGWALHVETGRDQAEDDTEAEDDTDQVLPATGDLYGAGHVEPRMGFVSPANDWAVED